MAFFEMNYQSDALRMGVTVNVILPEGAKHGEKYRTLYLLHGLSDDHTTWMRRTAIERYAKKHGLAVVMPNVDRCWYTDTAYGANYFSFVTKELPEVCFKTFCQMSKKREDNIVAGLSMGGYGAVKAALSCPEQYGTCISLSGSLDITRKGRPCNLNEWKSIFNFDMKDSLELEGSKHDLFALATKAKSEGKQLPRLYLWCGTGDDLIAVNRSFDRHLTELGIAHEFETSEGDHTWKWWDLHIREALKWAMN